MALIEMQRPGRRTSTVLTRRLLSNTLLFLKLFACGGGPLKNLVSGVSTVAHHNDLHPVMLEKSFPIRVVKHYGWAHSMKFSSDWQTRLLETPSGAPFMIHAAEGTDQEARQEIHTLDRFHALGPLTVLIHCVAAGDKELAVIRRRKSSVVWCPSSNHFTLGTSLVRRSPGVRCSHRAGDGFGHDRGGDLLDELRFASKSVTASRLYSMVTRMQREFSDCPRDSGDISHGGPADLLIMRDDRKTPAEALLSNLPGTPYHRLAGLCLRRRDSPVPDAA